MYLVRVMLLGILSVRTIKEHTEMPVVKRFFFLSGGKKKWSERNMELRVRRKRTRPEQLAHWSLVRKREQEFGN